MKRIDELMKEAGEFLESERVSEPYREARLLMGHSVSRDSAFLRAHPEYVPSELEYRTFREVVQRRGKHEPFQHIVGFQEFYGLRFEVGPDVLIPRPETELLVEESLKLLEAHKKPHILEIGTGSGCIAISILKNNPDATADATDISGPSVKIAQVNSESLEVSSRLNLFESDLYQAVPAGRRYDLIVTNPPYVPARHLEGLQPEVRDFEPRHALTDGAEGLDISRALIAEAPEFLRSSGYFLIEYGLGQLEKIVEMFDPDIWSSVETKSDLQSIPRIAVSRLRN